MFIPHLLFLFAIFICLLTFLKMNLTHLSAHVPCVFLETCCTLIYVATTMYIVLCCFVLAFLFNKPACRHWRAVDRVAQTVYYIVVKYVLVPLPTPGCAAVARGGWPGGCGALKIYTLYG